MGEGVRLHLALFIAGIILLAPLTAAADTIQMQRTPVGNPGNAADSTGFGAVRYSYNIGHLRRAK